MKQIKKFRKNNWSEDDHPIVERINPNKKRFDRALRTRDIDFLEDYED
jgi:hypothetical protein